MFLFSGKDICWDVTIYTRITGAKIIVERRKYSINLRYDNDRPTLISKIKNELSVVQKNYKITDEISYRNTVWK